MPRYAHLGPEGVSHDEPRIVVDLLSEILNSQLTIVPRDKYRTFRLRPVPKPGNEGGEDDGNDEDNEERKLRRGCGRWRRSFRGLGVSGDDWAVASRWIFLSS